jgi:hypothetical protein
VRPITSPCGGPPPNCGLATQEPARNAATASNKYQIRAGWTKLAEWTRDEAA